MNQKETSRLTESQLEELIGKRLKQNRLRQNLNQTELAERAGLARRTITSVENGNGCTLGTLIRLVRALKIEHTLEELIKPLPLSPNAIRQAQILAEPTRKHASKPRKKPPETGEWVWGDEQS
ncbi:MAG: helix-turn-helix transcriptional regulator [Akkermansiaceae bacterium]|nr:helix-turn-helix transcriptional regulator [Akkermansiaceae bacterium]